MNPGKLQISRFPTGSTILTQIEPSLRAMLEHIDEYIKTYHRPEVGKPELPYFFNERANIGLLAGGVWRSDPANLVLEEYGAPKKTDEGDYRGRFDFWCRAQGCSIYLEAKQTWGSLTNPEQSLGLITSHLQQEYHDAFRNAESDLQTGIVDYVCGVAFWVPYLAERHLMNAHHVLAAYDKYITEGLTAFVNQSGLEVLQARFFWADMLSENAVYQGNTGKWCHPLFDVYFASKEKMDVAMSKQIFHDTTAP